jgi:hypothetical protein
VGVDNPCGKIGSAKENIDITQGCSLAGYDSLHHHQPINVPTAGAQAFLTDYTLRE